MVALGDVHFVPAGPGSRLPPTYRGNGILLYTLDNNLMEKAVSPIPRSYENVLKPSFTVIADNQLILPVNDVKMSFSAKLKYDVHLYQISW